ncbi:WASH complex subunit homolog 5 [Drosophila willistoni]|uniref:WASH complex subunit homolog 5 n=1 Tax=Drosophila willistoni TaxID=7260 RepID=UPI00017D694F|nr:WASH complex subunit homolog 5 [Drosophila willistoni]
MTEFLAENNACGQNLLNIVSVGNSIIAEVLRLKDYVPSIYRLESKADKQKYGEVILDFSYFKDAEAIEKKIEESRELSELDDEVRSSHLPLIQRFYLAFQSIHHYATDLQQFIDELNTGYYIQQNLETLLQDEEGKQLLCESLYLYGVILLILDFHISGDVRERLMIAYYRYATPNGDALAPGCSGGIVGMGGVGGESNIHDVCLLLRSTGYQQPSTELSSNHHHLSTSVSKYPEAYFSRFQFDGTFIDLVIARLRCDDIYNQLAIYPHPLHRSTAFSTQAAMLYVCLYFCPQMLHTQTSQMREIIDKFFPDNWIISIYMGITVNLLDAWSDFKAANLAINQVVNPTMGIKSILQANKEQMLKTLQKSQDILHEGILNDDFVLEHANKIIILMRQANVLLRWYSLHTTKAVFIINPSAGHHHHHQVQKLLTNELNVEKQQIYQLLLNCSQMELVVKELLNDIHSSKSERFLKSRGEIIERLGELSEAFAGSRPLTKIEANSHLQQWFGQMAKQLNKLDLQKPQKSGRLIIQVMQALDEVQEYHNLHANMLVKQQLQETRDLLNRMAQLINLKEDLEIQIQMICDFSYAWQLLQRDYTAHMQEHIKRQPRAVIGIRAIFLKLASTLEVPLMRINQAKSEDLVSVSNYYSTELANFLRRVLQIVPETMFNILARIIQLLTNVIKEFPTRLEKEKLREYAQFEERFKVAQLTNSIAVFTKGILMMKRTLVGVIELDPKQLLEDGIRKELVNHLANAYNLGLIFTPEKGKSPVHVLQTKLQQLAKTIEGYRRSFEYIEDYLRVQGLRILLEESQRIINYNVEKECNSFLKIKIQEWQSAYQSPTIRIPNFPPLQGDASHSQNFIGRLAHEILRCTEPRSTIYLDLKMRWYEKRTPHHEILAASPFFALLREALAPAGLVGLERLYSHMLANELKINLDKLQKNLTQDRMWCETLANLTKELESREFPGDIAGKQPSKYYQSYCQRWLKVWPTILDWILALGQKQLLRQQIAGELSFSSKCDAKLLENTTDTLNKAFLLDLSIERKLCCEQGVGLLTELSDILLYTGNYEPLEQVFCFTKNTHNVSLFLTLFTIAHVGRLQHSVNTDCLLPRTAKDVIDCCPLIMGLLTVLHQFHKNVKMLYISYLSQYVVTLAEVQLIDSKILSSDVVTMLHFLQSFLRLARLPLSVLEQRIPNMILSEFEYLATPIK